MIYKKYLFAALLMVGIVTQSAGLVLLNGMGHIAAASLLNIYSVYILLLMNWPRISPSYESSLGFLDLNRWDRRRITLSYLWNLALRFAMLILAQAYLIKSASYIDLNVLSTSYEGLSILYICGHIIDLLIPPVTWALAVLGIDTLGGVTFASGWEGLAARIYLYSSVSLLGFSALVNWLRALRSYGQMLTSVAAVMR